ncbi:MAG: hypothetical protein A3F18_02070 [Legionellales bacterium RIFCSPHIGHO2_12_FULL_37_14]|nr:MAG: hypothetical protein A3F18_02070 [Legionellales bacterium RIFCSPHIGHO2_12_FULL_37_14]
MIITDLKGKVIAANDSFVFYTGLRKNSLIGGKLKKYFADSVEVDALFEIIRQQQKVYHCVLSLNTKLQKQKNVYVDAYYFSLPQALEQAVLIKLFPQSLKTSAAFVEYLDYNSIIAELNRTIKTAKKNTQNFIVAIINLDRFNYINLRAKENLGQNLLHQVEQRLQGLIQYPNLINKIGGDEYLMILHNVSSRKEINSLCSNILKAIAKGYNLDNEKYFLTASMGISKYPEIASSGENLMRYASLALKKAKDHGGACFQTVEPNSINLNIENDLYNALKQEELFLVYQPIIFLKSKHIFKLEALIRWKTSKGIIKYPDEFIPDFERFKLMDALGKYVIEKSISTLHTLQQKHNYRGMLSINFSASQLSMPLIRFLVKKLDQYKINHEHIWIEFTESWFIKMSHANEKILQTLKNLNLKQCIDDFGVKYSSLNYLNRISVDAIKIDKSFVQGLPNDPRSVAIVSGILTIGKMLNMHIIAEGIENAEQLTYLIKNDCFAGQGYFLSYPLNMDELIKFLQSTPSRS